MVYRIVLSCVGALALTGVALAADLPPQPMPPPPPPPPMWTGFYAGFNAGYEWMTHAGTNSTATPFFAAPTWDTELATSSALATGSTGGSSNGFIGGFQAGYNLQTASNFVVGFETDIQGILGKSANGSLGGAGAPAAFPDETIVSNVTSSSKLDYIGTARGRIGYLITPTVLLYGTGGLAYGQVSTTTSVFQANLPLTPSFGSAGTVNATRVGWTAGGGLEWMIMPNLSLKAEYLYYNLGSVTNNLGALTFIESDAPAPLQYSSGVTSRTRFNGNIVRAGIDYHFDWARSLPFLPGH